MQSIQTMKHFGLKHALQRFLFPFPLLFLFKSICKTIRCSCNNNACPDNMGNGVFLITIIRQCKRATEIYRQLLE
jgi:hypothetical protein